MAGRLRYGVCRISAWQIYGSSRRDDAIPRPRGRICTPHNRPTGWPGLTWFEQQRSDQANVALRRERAWPRGWHPQQWPTIYRWPFQRSVFPSINVKVRHRRGMRCNALSEVRRAAHDDRCGAFTMTASSGSAAIMPYWTVSPLIFVVSDVEVVDEVIKFPVLFPVSREFRTAVWDERFGAEIFLSISLSSKLDLYGGRQFIGGVEIELARLRAIQSAQFKGSGDRGKAEHALGPLSLAASCMDGCAGRSAKGRRWKSVTVKE